MRWLVLLGIVALWSLPTTARALSPEVAAVLSEASVAASACRLRVATPQVGALRSLRRVGVIIEIRAGSVGIYSDSGEYHGNCLTQLFTRALRTLENKEELSLEVNLEELQRSRRARVTSRALRWVLAQMQPRVARCGPAAATSGVSLRRRGRETLLWVNDRHVRRCVVARFQLVLQMLRRDRRRRRASAHSTLLFNGRRTPARFPRHG